MCYKDERQKKAAELLDVKVKELPEFIQNYFIRFNSNLSKVNYFSSISLLLKWLIKQNIINKHSINELEPNDLKLVTDTHIMKYLDGLKIGLYGIGEDELDKPTKITSLSTIITKKNCFRAFWGYLRKKKYVDDNIIENIPSTKYKLEEKEVDCPDDGAYWELITNIHNQRSDFLVIRDIAIIRLFAGSGIRLSELIGLDLKDLYLNALSKSGNKSPYIMIMSKGYQSEQRKVMITNEAAEAVSEYLKYRSKLERLRSNAVFISERNDRITTDGVEYFFKAYSGGKITPHKLRHYVGTKMAENGVQIAYIQDQLGHASPTTTSKHYIKKNEDKMREALDSL